MNNSEFMLEKVVKDRLKKKQLDILDLISLFCVFIISRKYIKTNAEVSEFIEQTLKEKFPSYVVKSRTLMAARTCRVLLNIEEIDDDKVLHTMRVIIRNSEEISEKDKVIKRSRKGNENDKLEKWLRGFGNAE